MEISLTDRVRKEVEIWRRAQEEGHILHTTKRRVANWAGHILHRNCLLKHIIEGNTEGKRRQGRRSKQLLDDIKEKRGYWKLKEESLDRTIFKTRFGRG